MNSAHTFGSMGLNIRHNISKIAFCTHRLKTMNKVSPSSRPLVLGNIILLLKLSWLSLTSIMLLTTPQQISLQKLQAFRHGFQPIWSLLQKFSIFRKHIGKRPRVKHLLWSLVYILDITNLQHNQHTITISMQQKLQWHLLWGHHMHNGNKVWQLCYKKNLG